MDFITLRRAALAVTICTIGTFYQGTRFDWLGIVKSLEFEDTSYVDEWFTVHDPKNHEHVCGPAEVFSPIGYDKAVVGGTFFLPGVGLLVKADDKPYSEFTYYPIADRGTCSLDATTEKAVYRQHISGVYDYEKSIEITSDNSFAVRHKITNLSSELFESEVYCHNFFTMGTQNVTKGREIIVPFIPEGKFQRENDFVVLEGSTFRYTRDLGNPFDSVKYFFDNKDTSSGWSFEYRESDRSVKGSCDKPFSHTVIWNNSRVACYEPYINISIAPGESFSWTYSYTLD